MRTTRPKPYVFMEVARTLAQLGTCDRKQVGAVIIREGRCITWGYNGAPPGAPHCDENNHGWGNVDESAGVGLDTVGCRNATHAEANAIAFAARQGISTDDGVLFVTVAPCAVCARLIIAAGIVRVYYDEPYREEDGCRILQGALIQTTQLL